MSRSMRTAMVGLLALTLAAPGLWASGFSVYEQGAKPSGMAGAFTALADDAAANWYNPGALVFLDENAFQAGINLITAGGDSELTANDPSFGIFTDTTFEAEDEIVTPIHVYYVHKFTPNIAFGIGVNNPFGLVTEWNDRPITFSAQRSELVTFVVNPNISFRLGDNWGLAFGIDYIFADIKEFSREVPINLDANPFTFEVIGQTNLTGDGDDLGWNLGLSYQSEGFAFGFSYRSELSPEIDGDIAFSNFGPLAPFFVNSPGTATLDLPSQAAVGIAWKTGALTIDLDIAYAEWSRFETLVVDVDNNIPGFVEDIALREDWDDTFSYRIGLDWALSSTHSLRVGAVYDESPVPEETLRPSIPDADRYAPTFGYGFHGGRVDVDAYYMALFFDDITARGNEEGVINGTYETFVHLAGLTVSFRF